MRFEGLVWRHIPRGAHPLDFSALIRAAGRWNRAGLYGCVYTAPTPAAVAAEYRKQLVRRGLWADRDLVCLSVRVEHVLDLYGLVVGGGATDRNVPGPQPGPRQLLLPRIEGRRLVKDRPSDLAHCREISDWTRRAGFLAIRAPSAAMEGEVILAIYPENRPRELRIEVHSENVPLNYGEDPFVDGEGFPVREAP